MRRKKATKIKGRGHPSQPPVQDSGWYGKAEHAVVPWVELLEFEEGA